MKWQHNEVIDYIRETRDQQKEPHIWILFTQSNVFFVLHCLTHTLHTRSKLLAKYLIILTNTNNVINFCADFRTTIMIIINFVEIIILIPICRVLRLLRVKFLFYFSISWQIGTLTQQRKRWIFKMYVFIYFLWDAINLYSVSTVSKIG